MPQFITKKVVQALIERGKNPGECRVLVMGITFKENVADIRNSKVVDLIRELKEYSIKVDVVDPYASPEEVMYEYNITLQPEPNGLYDCFILTVGHVEYKALHYGDLLNISNGTPIVFDVKGVHTGLQNLEYLKL